MGLLRVCRGEQSISNFLVNLCSYLHPWLTERIRSWIQAAEMSFLRRVAGRSLRDVVRSSVTQKELGMVPLLLHIERSSGTGICIGCPRNTFLGRCSWHVLPGGDPKKDPGHTGVTMSLGRPGNALGSSRKSCRKCPGRGKSGCLCSDSCPLRPGPR